MRTRLQSAQFWYAAHPLASSRVHGSQRLNRQRKHQEPDCTNTTPYFSRFMHRDLRTWGLCEHTPHFRISSPASPPPPSPYPHAYDDYCLRKSRAAVEAYGPIHGRRCLQGQISVWACVCARVSWVAGYRISALSQSLSVLQYLSEEPQDAYQHL